MSPQYKLIKRTRKTTKKLRLQKRERKRKRKELNKTSHFLTDIFVLDTISIQKAVFFNKRNIISNKEKNKYNFRNSN